MINETIYKNFKFTFGKTTWSIMTGGMYIVVIKTSQPKHMQFGKTFNSFDSAQKHYNCPKLKTALLQVELGLVEPTEIL